MRQGHTPYFVPLFLFPPLPLPPHLLITPKIKTSKARTRSEKIQAPYFLGNVAEDVNVKFETQGQDMSNCRFGRCYDPIPPLISRTTLSCPCAPLRFGVRGVLNLSARVTCDIFAISCSWIFILFLIHNLDVISQGPLMIKLSSKQHSIIHGTSGCAISTF